jgi:redox-sensitive bicupin YhaK (pirin superfamily)
MSAGTGVLHSEENPSRDTKTHLLQIWLLPERRNLTPEYEQKAFPPAERDGTLRLVASQDGREGSVTIHTDASLYTVNLDGTSVTHDFAPGRHGWLQVARGSATVNGTPLAQGDGAAISDEARVTIEGTGAEVLLFDLA